METRVNNPKSANISNESLSNQACMAKISKSEKSKDFETCDLGDYDKSSQLLLQHMKDMQSRVYRSQCHAFQLDQSQCTTEIESRPHLECCVLVQCAMDVMQKETHFRKSSNTLWWWTKFCWLQRPSHAPSDLVPSACV